MALQSSTGSTVNITFTVFDIDGTTPATGHVGADFVSVLRHEGVVSALPVTITELGGGDYLASFVPDAVGIWSLRIQDPYDAHRGATVQVSPEDIGDAVSVSRKYLTNAQRVDFGTQELVIIDDDGVTVLQRHDLTTDGGEPVSTHPGVQTRRGVGKQ